MTVTTPCTIHTGYIMPNGYGRDYIDGRHVSAHRAAYERAYGPVPDGLVVDHLCRVRSCVNPDHLEAVTQAENLRRGAGPGSGWELPRPTHCKHGHPFTPENTIERPNRYGNAKPHWECRECGRRRNRAYKARRRAAADQVQEVDHAGTGSSEPTGRSVGSES